MVYVDFSVSSTQSLFVFTSDRLNLMFAFESSLLAQIHLMKNAEQSLIYGIFVHGFVTKNTTERAMCVFAFSDRQK